MTMTASPMADDEARRIVTSLGGRWNGVGGMCRCPAHDDRTPSLSVRAGTRRVLFHCFAGCDASDVLRALAAAGLLTGKRSVAPAHRSVHQRRSGGVGRLWDEARSISGTPAESYLRARRLFPTSDVLRFHSHVPHGRRPLTQFRPAMLAGVHDEAGLVAVQRTFLNTCADGAGEKVERATLGRVGQGAVRLHPPGRCLGLAEGVETALAATALFAIPCWATLGAERFGSVALPAIVRELFLFIDHDEVGVRAEMRARRAFAGGYALHTLRPPLEGDDWNDVLLRQPVSEC